MQLMLAFVKKADYVKFCVYCLEKLNICQAT